MKQIIVSWSSGKDSALALHRLMQDENVQVAGLMTTHVNQRIPFQETPLQVVRAQAERLQLPLIEIELPETFPENEVYQSIIVDCLKSQHEKIDGVAFGDIYCNGIEAYRRSYLEPAGYKCFFPLIHQTSDELAHALFSSGIEATIITVDTEQLDGNFVGKKYSNALIKELPQGVDFCGEDGEFHTLVTNMPEFSSPLKIERQSINRDGRFHYLNYDLVI